MAHRIRTLKPEHRHHRKVGRLTHFEYRLWVAMITEADDEGRLAADAEQLRVLAFAYHPRVTAPMVETAIQRLAALVLICLYDVGGIRYAWFPSWFDHQRVNRPTPSKLPPPPAGVAPPIAAAPPMTANGPAPTAPIHNCPEDFERFWTVYPRKCARGTAEKAWAKLRPPIDAVVKALEVHRQSPEWTKDGGRFIPHPATWLTGTRWLDEVGLGVASDSPQKATRPGDKTAGNSAALDEAERRLLGARAAR